MWGVREINTSWALDEDAGKERLPGGFKGSHYKGLPMSFKSANPIF